MKLETYGRRLKEKELLKKVAKKIKNKEEKSKNKKKSPRKFSGLGRGGYRVSSKQGIKGFMDII